MYKEENAKIRESLIKALEKYGTTLSFLSKQTFLARETLSRFRNGHQDLHPDTLNRISNVLIKMSN